MTPEWRPQRTPFFFINETKKPLPNQAQPQRSRAATKKPKPTTLRRTSGQATTPRHGEKPEKTSCTAEARSRGEEFYFDEKFVQKTRKFGISDTETRRKTKIKGLPQRARRAQRGAEQNGF